ncbi:MAG: tetratricopeptide repeat protein [Alphaproteobacteria bacterium]
MPEIPRTLFAAGLAALLALTGCARAPEDMRLVDAGAGAFAAGDTDGSEERLRTALNINPDNGYALMTLAAVYERTGRGADAVKLYAAAAERYGKAPVSALGIEATERAAFAALARERLALFEGRDAAKQAKAREAAADRAALGKIFANLTRITDNLNGLSSSVRSAADRVAALTRPGPPIDLAPGVGGGKADNGQAGSAAAKPAAMPEPPPGPRIRLHLASFRSAAKAKKGWDEVTAVYPDLLDGLGFESVRVDLGPGMGVFYRVLAGPVASEKRARALCRQFKTRGAFCALVFN